MNRQQHIRKIALPYKTYNSDKDIKVSKTDLIKLGYLIDGRIKQNDIERKFIL